MSGFDRRSFMGAAGALGSAAMLGAKSALAKPDDANGLNLDPSPGPAAWLDEYWDVKPGKLKDFVAVYQQEICELARHIPGYRGFSIMTSFPPDPPDDTTIKVWGGPDEVLTPHFGVRFDGEVSTSTSINYAALMKKCFNVQVTHHLQTWSAANRFKTNLHKAYADKSDGFDLNIRLAETLYPLTNNMWRANYRLLWTGFAGNLKGPKKGKDADGLNLDPYVGARNLNVEFAYIKPGREQAYFDVLRDGLYNAIRVNPGYRGMSVLTSVPPLPSELPMDLDGVELGAPDTQFVYERGMLINGTTRTDRFVNFGQLFRKTFNCFYVHYFAPDDPGLASNVRIETFARKHDGRKLLDFYGDTLFVEETNHWENNYRMVAQSFAPHAEKGA